MSLIKCCVPGCELKPEYLCSCTTPKSIICTAHLNNHGDPKIISHSFENLFIRPLEKTKSIILACLKEEKRKINSIKEKIISDNSEKIKKTEDFLNNGVKALTSGIKTIDLYIVTILTTNEISRNCDNSLLKLLLLNPDEVLFQVGEVIKDNIDFGFIADNCDLNEKSDGMAIEIIEKINKLEIEVKELREEVVSLRELKEEVKSLREIICIQASHQSSIVEIPKEPKNNEESKEIASAAKDLNQELQSQMLSMTTRTPLNSLISEEKFDFSIGSLPIVLQPDQKHGLKDFGNTSYINSVLQFLSSFNVIVDMLKDSDNYLLRTINELLRKMKEPNTTAAIDDLLLKAITALTQAYPIISENKDPRLLLEFILCKFNEECPINNLFTVTKHSCTVCSSGHSSESMNIESILSLYNLVNIQLNDAIEALKFPKCLDIKCNTCNRVGKCDVTIFHIELPCFLIISLDLNNDFTLPKFFYYENTKYELFGVIKKVYNQASSDKYIAYTNDGGVWRKYDNEYSDTNDINFKGCYIAAYVNA